MPKKFTGPDVWLNSDLRLWRVDGLPEYLSGAGVFRVMWRGDDWRVILYGMLPHNISLFDGGATFEVRETKCGPLDNYDIGNTVMRFTSCWVTRKWIARPVAVCPDEVDVVNGYIELACDVEVIDPYAG